MLEEWLKEATFTDDQQARTLLIQELARSPHEVRNALGELLRKHQRHLYPVVADVIRAIGYPGNASLVRLLLDCVGNKNSTVWQEAVQLLIELGVQEVTPPLVQFLLRRDDHQYWGDDVEGICSMLCVVDQAFTMPCVPLLVYLLGREDLPSPHNLDRGFLLDVLEKVGTRNLAYALPTLIAFIKKEGTSDIGKQASRLITSFDKETLEPYKLVLPSPPDTSSAGG